MIKAINNDENEEHIKNIINSFLKMLCILIVNIKLTQEII